MVFPPPIGIGLLKVPVIRPTTAVQLPLPILIGCSVIARSGMATKSLQVLDVLGETVRVVSVRPGDGDVLGVTLLEAVPLLVAEDREIEGVERREVASDGLGRIVLCLCLS